MILGIEVNIFDWIIIICAVIIIFHHIVRAIKNIETPEHWEVIVPWLVLIVYSLA